MKKTIKKRIKKKATGATNRKIMERALSNPKYKGKHIIVVAGKIFTARTGDGASNILRKINQKYPNKMIDITYVPKADSLILFYDG